MMNSFAERKGFFKYLSFDKEPRWFTIFTHIGFGVGLLLGIAGLVLAYLY